MRMAKQTEEQTADGPDMSEARIRRLLRQRARERAAPLRWSIDSAILGCVCLAAVITMSLKYVALPITVATACVGITLVWLSSWLRIRKLENRFYQEELDDYAQRSHSRSPEAPYAPETQDSGSRVDSSLTPRELAVLE